MPFGIKYDHSSACADDQFVYEDDTSCTADGECICDVTSGKQTISNICNWLYLFARILISIPIYFLQERVTFVAT